MRVEGIEIALTKAAVVLAPSYLAAFLTEQMVWVGPTLAASSFVAASLHPAAEVERRTEEEVDAHGEDASSAEG